VVAMRMRDCVPPASFGVIQRAATEIFMSSLQPTVASRHEYRVRGAKVYPIVGAAAIGILIPIFYLAGGVQAALLSGLALVVIVGLLVFYCQRSRLVLDDSQLQVTTLLQNRTVPLSEVDGIRTYRTRYSTYKVICVKGRGRALQFTKFAIDDAFREWLQGLPDLDLRDRDQVLAEIAADQELGSTPEERLQALSRAKWINIGACVMAAAAGCGYVFGGEAWRGWCYAALILAPVAALFLLYRSPLLYTMFKRKSDPRVETSVLLMIGGMGLLFRSMSVNFVSSSELVRYTAGVLVVFLFAFYRPAAKSKQVAGALLAVLLFGVFYAWGAVVGLDRMKDPTPVETYEVTVTGKHYSSGRSTTYYLSLERWGPFNGPVHSMEVSSSLYHEVNAGDAICIALHAGMLHAAWYEPVECPAYPVSSPSQ